MLRIPMDIVPRSPISFESDAGGRRREPRLEPAEKPRVEPQDFSLSSESFEDGGIIPEALARERGISPQLSWKNAPEGTDRFVIIMDDPDGQQAVGYTFVHWVAALPGGSRSLEEGASAGGWTGRPKVVSGNYATSTAYRGPKPPSGTHRYHIAVYAMSNTFDDPEFENLAGSVADDTQTCTREHFEALYTRDILAKAEITGRYSAGLRTPH
jgi:Raf kinase inhibitor-like YbhB/YbcL family protein